MTTFSIKRFHFENFLHSHLYWKTDQFYAASSFRIASGTQHTDVLKVTEKKISLRSWKKGSRKEDGLPRFLLTCPPPHKRTHCPHRTWCQKSGDTIFESRRFCFSVYTIQHSDVCSEHCWDFSFYIQPHLVPCEPGLERHFESLDQHSSAHITGELDCTAESRAPAQKDRIRVSGVRTRNVCSHKPSRSFGGTLSLRSAAMDFGIRCSGEDYRIKIWIKKECWPNARILEQLCCICQKIPGF